MTKRVKLPEGENSVMYGGQTYTPDAEGYAVVPDDVAIAFGLVETPQEEVETVETVSKTISSEKQQTGDEAPEPTPTPEDSTTLQKLEPASGEKLPPPEEESADTPQEESPPETAKTTTRKRT